MYTLPFQKENINWHQQNHFLKIPITKLNSQGLWSLLNLQIRFPFNISISVTTTACYATSNPITKTEENCLKKKGNVSIFMVSYS
jgi:hypothetical protein